MAKVVKVGKKFGVAHDVTGKILVRKGKRVIHPTRAAAEADVRATRCRVMNICPVGSSKSRRITPKTPRLRK